MSDEKDAAGEIEVMKAHLGVNLDRELAEKLGIDPSSVAAWRRRGSVPTKYQVAYRRAQDERLVETTQSVSVSAGRLREAYVFSLLEIVAKTPIPDAFYHLPENWFITWRGIRLANAYSYIDDLIPTTEDRDELRSDFEKVKKEIESPGFLEWLETVI